VISVDPPHRIRRFALPFDEIRAPAFSPDGKRIAFSGVRAGVSDIHVLDLAAGKITAITSDRHDDHAPHWRPDGKRIAYHSERDAQTDLFTVEVETGKIERLTHTLAMERTPRWSPDGTKILYSSDAGGIYNLYVMDAVRRHAWRLTDVQGGAFGGAWSPDAAEVVFSYYRHGNLALFRLPVALAGDPQPVAAEDERRGEYERFFLRERQEDEVRPFRDRFAAELLFPLILVNFGVFSDLRGDHVIEVLLAPSFGSGGTILQGDITYWDRSHRADVGLSVFALNEFSADDDDDGKPDNQESQVGARLLMRYPFDSYRSLTVGYEAFRERESVNGVEVLDELEAGPFAVASYSTVVRRGLDAVTGLRLAAGGAWRDEDFGSDRKKSAWFAAYTQYFQLTRDQILVAHLEVGGIDGPGQADLDVARVVRGVTSGRFEGQRRLGASVEYRFPLLRDINAPLLGEGLLLKDVRGFLFADVGFATLLSLDDVAGEFDHPDWKASVGAGIRLDMFVLQKLPLRLGLFVAKVEGEHDLATRAAIGTRF
jgi:hypothetical protein